MDSTIKNLQLRNDLEKLLSYDDYVYTDITTDYDPKLGFILDIKDNGYFYESEEERDSDDKVFCNLIQNKFY